MPFSCTFLINLPWIENLFLNWALRSSHVARGVISSNYCLAYPSKVSLKFFTLSLSVPILSSLNQSTVLKVWYSGCSPCWPLKIDTLVLFFISCSLGVAMSLIYLILYQQFLSHSVLFTNFILYFIQLLITFFIFVI